MMERSQMFRLDTSQVLADFNREHGSEFDTIEFLGDHDLDLYLKYSYVIGSVSESGDGSAAFSKIAVRTIIQSGASQYVEPDKSGGIFDKYLDRVSVIFFQIKGLESGTRKLYSRIRTVYTTGLKDPSIVQYLDSGAIPEYKEILATCIENSASQISSIYRTCQTRNFKSGWAYHKLKELCESKSFQQPFLRIGYYTDPKPIYSDLWDKFLEQYRPQEWEDKQVKARINVSQLLGDW